jgi:hypothetical protein
MLSFKLNFILGLGLGFCIVCLMVIGDGSPPHQAAVKNQQTQQQHR